MCIAGRADGGVSEEWSYITFIYLYNTMGAWHKVVLKAGFRYFENIMSTTDLWRYLRIV